MSAPTLERMKAAAARKRPLVTPAAIAPASLPPVPPPPPPPAEEPKAAPQPLPAAAVASPATPAGRAEEPRPTKLREPRRHLEGKPASYHDAVAAVRGRLPDQSEVHCRYHDGLRQWTGELITPGARFEGHASGLFSLLHELDTQFRRWKLAQQAGGTVENAGATT